mgnify:FL=1
MTPTAWYGEPTPAEGQPWYAQAAFVQKPRPPYPVGGGPGDACAAQARATRTSETAHPQLHAGTIARHPANSYMLRHRRGRGIPCRLHTSHRKRSHEEYSTIG